MKFKKLCVLLIGALLISLTACGKGENVITVPQKYSLPKQMKTIKSNVVSENENYSLYWDNEKYCVSLERKSDGTVWSTTPYKYYKSETVGSQYAEDGLRSAIKVTYVDKKNNDEAEAVSNSSADYVLAGRLKNGGLKVTYYFDSIKVSVPIIYLLNDDGLSVSLDIAGIKEGKNLVTKVSLLPFFASAENAEGNYIFVPSGSGAIINTVSETGTGKFYSEPVYGSDLSDPSIYQITNTQSIKMPVFGIKNGSDSLFAVITNGDDIAEISASAGDQQYGFSGVYATFNVRGKTSSNVKGHTGSNSQLIKYSEGIVALNRATVRYFPLEKDKGDYNCMAQKYREYLTENKDLKSDRENVDVMLTVLGGANKKQFFCGIPYNTFSTMTTLSQAEEITKDLKNNGVSMALNLKGFGNGGVDNSYIGGKFGLNGKLGSKKELEEFANWCKKNSVDAFYDFNMMLYDKSGSGYSTKNSATDPSGVRAKNYEYTLVVKEQDTSSKRYLNSREALARSYSDILNAADKLKINGIGLSSLSELSYSDYRSSNYFCKANMSVDVERILKKLKSNKYLTFGESANAYAAANLDYIFNSPTESSLYTTLDYDIPFYQMVFRGSASISGRPINLYGDAETDFLNTVSTASSLGFVVCDHVDSELVKNNYSAASQGVYSGISDTIKSYSEKIKPVLDKTKGATIVSYVKSGNVSTTVFSNGATVIVNYGNDTLVCDEHGEIGARSFICY